MRHLLWLLFVGWIIADVPASAQPDERWWKHLPSEKPAAWTDEAAKLMRRGAQDEAVAVLAEAVRRFTEDREVAALHRRLASFLADDPRRSFDTCLKDFKATPGLQERLQLASLLGWCATRAKTADILLSELETAQRKEPENAARWLELAAIHAAMHDEVRHDECVRAAAQLNPRAAEVLKALPRFQEDAGMHEQRLHTLQAAAAAAPEFANPELARHEILHGDVEQGLRLYDKLAHFDGWNPDSLVRMAQALALVGEWPRTHLLLTPQISRFPQDYRLRCLLAVTHEEEGRIEEAIAAWLEVLAMKSERPGIPPMPWLQPWSGVPMPGGTKVWRHLSGVLNDAYSYRSQFARHASDGLYAGAVDSMLPASLENVPFFAFAHLRSLHFHLPSQARDDLMTKLQRLGYAEAADLLTVPLKSNHLRVDGDYLDNHPRNLALHASWYLDKHQFNSPGGRMISGLIMEMPGSDPTPARLAHCFEVFAADYPELALNVAHHCPSDEKVRAALPHVISCLGPVSMQTLFDLSSISRRDSVPVRAAIAAKIEGWLNEDRVPVSARAELVKLVAAHRSAGNQQLGESLDRMKKREGWPEEEPRHMMYFNDFLHLPGDGSAPRWSRRETPPRRSNRQQVQDRRRSAEASAKLIQSHVTAKDQNAARAELRLYLEIAASDWLDFSPGDASHIGLNHLQYVLGKDHREVLRESVDSFAKDTDSARYGALLEMNGLLDEAANAYQRAKQAGRRDAHLIRRMAVLAAREDVKAGLALFDSIPLFDVPEAIDCLASDCSRGNGYHQTLKMRLANARLLTAWLERRAAARQPLWKPFRLEHALESLGWGDSRTKDYAGLFGAPHEKDWPPCPEELRQAFHNLGRAFLKFPETAMSAFASITAVESLIDGITDAHYEQGLRLLKDIRVTTLETPDNIQSSQRFPEHEGVPRLHPAIFVTEHAVLSKPSGTFENEVIPVVIEAYGREFEPCLRTYAALCAATDETFIPRAKAWLESPGPKDDRQRFFPENQLAMREAFVRCLWEKKKLTVPIGPLLQQKSR